FVRARLDVDVVVLREAGARLDRLRVGFFGTSLAAIKRNWRERRSDIHPFMEILRQQQLAGSIVLGQVTRPGLRLRAAAGEPLREYRGCHDHGTRYRYSCRWRAYTHRCSPCLWTGLVARYRQVVTRRVDGLKRGCATLFDAILSVLRDCLAVRSTS